MREVVTRSDMPSPSLPFSAGMRANGFVFTSGQVGTDPRSGQVAGPDVASQTRQAIDNLRAVLEAGGSSLDRLVKTTVFLADIRLFDGRSPTSAARAAGRDRGHRRGQLTITLARMPHGRS